MQPAKIKGGCLLKMDTKKCDWSEEGTTRRTETETETRDQSKTLPSRVGFLGLQVSESRPFARLRLGERHGQIRLALDETAKQSLLYCWRFVGGLLAIFI